MKNTHGKYSILLGGLSIAILAASVIYIVFISEPLDFNLNTPHPSDYELIQNFQNNEADFARLNQMAKEDQDFVRIAYDFNWTKESAAFPRPKSEKDLSRERWDEYRNLFKKLNLKTGILNYQPDSVWFISSSRGLVTGGSSKGYMYLIKEPSSEVDSLDNPNFDRPELEGRHIKILYRKLKDNWYLYYEYE